MGPIGTAALGIGTGLAEGAAEQIFGEMNQKRELRGQKKALERQNAAAMDIWEKTNYKAQMGQLEKAGLNAGLIYGMGGAGGTLGGGNEPKTGTKGTKKSSGKLASLGDFKRGLSDCLRVRLSVNSLKILFASFGEDLAALINLCNIL